MKNNHASGFTLLEVLVAAVIVVGTIGAISVVVRTADRFKARALHLRAAATIAQNSSELLRAGTHSLVIAGDSSYIETIHAIAFMCKRTLLDTIISASSHEYSLSIYTAADTQLVREFRLRQGSGNGP